MRTRRQTWITVVVLLTLFAVASYWWLEARHLGTPPVTDSTYTEFQPEPFPVGVDPKTETITEAATLAPYLEQHFSYLQNEPSQLSLLSTRIKNAIKQSILYQQLASPSVRQLIISPGDHPETVFSRVVTLFNWSQEEQTAFTNILDAGQHEHTVTPIIPGTYTLSRNSTPIAVYNALEDTFLAELKSRYPEATETVVPLREAMILASLLEREAAGFYDMRYISGVIWNRRFIDMNLQIDATLQYAKTIATDNATWPPVNPDDKYIESPFNTYQNLDLPPAPIAIPSVAAVIATLNPRSTECIFYFHNRNREFFCSPTYEEHVEKLIQQYGQGR